MQQASEPRRPPRKPLASDRAAAAADAVARVGVVVVVAACALLQQRRAGELVMQMMASHASNIPGMTARQASNFTQLSKWFLSLLPFSSLFSLQ